MMTNSISTESLHSLQFLLLLLLAFLLVSIPTTAAATFTCKGPTRRCTSIIGFVPANSTTYSSLKSLFQVKSIRDLLSSNDLPPTTNPKKHRALAGVPVRIPIPCSCSSNGTGVSLGRPVYKVKKGDGLDMISREIFGGFVVYEEVAKANGIEDPDKINVGEKLRIPLPCSCDQVGGRKVVHYAHKVAQGSTVGEIATHFGVEEEELMALNEIKDADELKAEQILDVPLLACNSSIRGDSLDSKLLVANGSYALTAGNCVQCSCTSSTMQLQCTPTNGFNSSMCPTASCLNGSLTLGESRGGNTACESTMCSYAGYNHSSIFTLPISNNTCPSGSIPSQSPPGKHLLGWQTLGWIQLPLIISVFF